MKEDIKIGDYIYEIHSRENILYINRRVISKMSKKGRIICGFEVFNGVKIHSINQFNRSYRHWAERGIHLNMFRLYSLAPELENNIELFKKKYKKQTGIELQDIKFNFPQ
jgi:hypothetical protein